MKRILSLLLALALVFSLVGCQASNWPPETTYAPETSAATTQATTVPEETPAPTTEPETEPTAAPTEKPEPKPTEPKPTEPKPTEPAVTLPAQTDPQPEPQPPIMPPETEPTTAPTQPEAQKSYTRKDEVALYIHEHGCLPDNFITKSEARALGWKSGSLEKYAPGKCIGGDRFYNREGLLPAGHTYYECDIDTLGKASRGAKRIVFSTDGLIYYTSDHYRSFTLLYGEP